MNKVWFFRAACCEEIKNSYLSLIHNFFNCLHCWIMSILTAKKKLIPYNHENKMILSLVKVKLIILNYLATIEYEKSFKDYKQSVCLVWVVVCGIEKKAIYLIICLQIMPLFYLERNCLEESKLVLFNIVMILYRAAYPKWPLSY